ncbi:MAG: hypothetical protein ACQEVQ_06620 [Pseudomonadota bacterium]
MKPPEDKSTETDNSLSEREGEIFEAFNNGYSVENCDNCYAQLGEEYESHTDDADSLVWENDIPSIDN